MLYMPCKDLDATSKEPDVMSSRKIRVIGHLLPKPQTCPCEVRWIAVLTNLNSFDILLRNGRINEFGDVLPRVQCVQTDLFFVSHNTKGQITDSKE